MSREPGNKSKTANCPTFAAELDTPWKYNKEKTEKHTLSEDEKL